MKKLLTIVGLLALTVPVLAQTITGSTHGPGAVQLAVDPVAGPVTVTLRVALREDFSASYATVPGGTASAQADSEGAVSVQTPSGFQVLTPETSWQVGIDMGIPGPVTGVHFGYYEEVSWVDPDGFRPGETLDLYLGYVLSTFGGTNLKSMSVDTRYQYEVVIE